MRDDVGRELESVWHKRHHQLVDDYRQRYRMPARTDRLNALGLGVQVLRRVCNERSSVVRLHHWHALDRLLAGRASAVSGRVFK